jgi:hypothetical protein
MLDQVLAADKQFDPAKFKIVAKQWFEQENITNAQKLELVLRKHSAHTFCMAEWDNKQGKYVLQFTSKPGRLAFSEVLQCTLNNTAKRQELTLLQTWIKPQENKNIEIDSTHQVQMYNRNFQDLAKIVLV